MCSSGGSPSVTPAPTVVTPPPPPDPEPTAEAPVVENPGATKIAGDKRRGKQALRIPLTVNTPGTSGTTGLNIPQG